MKRRHHRAPTDAKVRIVERYEVKHTCGHRTIHDPLTLPNELLRLADSICPDCKELEK